MSMETNNYGITHAYTYIHVYSYFGSAAVVC